MARVNSPEQTIPESFKEIPGLWEHLEETAVVLRQLRRRTGGGDDAIAEVQISELYESGIQTFDQEDISSSVEEAPLHSDLVERVEDLENQISLSHSEPLEIEESPLTLSLLERVEDLENEDVTPHIDIAGISFEIVTITADFTTTGNQIIICNNTSAITVTMNAQPDDGERAYIKRRNAPVKAISTLGIDGQTTAKAIVNRYDCPLLVYTAEIDEYSII